MPFEIVLIVAVSILGAIILNHQESKKEIAKAQAKAAAKAPANDDMHQRIEALTRRLETLEAIVTDEDRALTRRFDELRENTKRGAI